MPKRKRSEQEICWSKFVENIEMRRKVYELSSEQIAKALKMSMPTYFKHKNNPWTWKLEDLEIIADRLHTTPVKLLMLEGFQNVG